MARVGRGAGRGVQTVLACDLGGTRLRTALVEPMGSIALKEAILTPKDDHGALARAMRSMLAKAQRPVEGAVVGVAGPVDYTQGKVLALPNLQQWGDHVAAADLSADLGISVLVANDADLAALGEHRYGAGRGYEDMVYVTISTGIGAGVIIGNRLLHGRLSLAEAGHTVIDFNTGATLEDLASGTALGRAAGQDAALVSGKAAQGDPEALRHFNHVANVFAVGILNLVRCFSPQVVVIGGGMSQAGELLLGPIRAMLEDSDLLPHAPRVTRAEGNDDVGLLGAFAYWRDRAGETQRA